MKKRIFSLITAGIIAFSSFTQFGVSAAAPAYINNASLMPKYVPDSQVTLDSEGTPEWATGLIMAGVRIRTATKEGTLKAAIKVLDHYQEMGVNGLWILPIYDPGEKGNGYSNLGPQSIDPAITGKEGKNKKTSIDDYKEGWQVLKEFVDEAHKRNIRIILDVLSYGVADGSNLPTEHPEWFAGDNQYGEHNFKWRDPKTEELNQPFVDWYKDQLVEIAVMTGIDGFRFDSEPRHAGYEVHEYIRQSVLKAGRKLLYISEADNERGRVYDLEQMGVRDSWSNRLLTKPKMTFLDKYNLVDCIKNGVNIGSQASEDLGDGCAYRFYTHGLTSHDHLKSTVQGRRLAIGYQAIYAPFIPLWYMGEEWNETYSEKLIADDPDKVLYVYKIDWDNLDKPENRKFYEDVKAMIRVRRSYPEIFNYFPASLRDTNICKVSVTGCEDDLAYARYSGDTAIIVVPNYNVHDKSGKMTVYLPFKDMGLDYYSRYTVTNAITGKSIVSGNAKQVSSFAITVPRDDMCVIKVKATGKYEPKQEETIEDNTSSTDNTSSVISDDTNEEPDPESSTGGKYVKKRKPKSASGDGSSNINTIIIVVSVVGGVIVIAGVTGFILYRKKKHSVKKQS